MSEQRHLDSILLTREIVGISRSYSFTDCSRDQQVRYLDDLNEDELKRAVLHLADQLRIVGDQYDIILPKPERALFPHKS